MLDWPSPFPIVAAKAEAATLTSVDGQSLMISVLAIHASMFGHSPPALATALAEQAFQGLSFMLPKPKGAELADMLTCMFGQPHW